MQDIEAYYTNNKDKFLFYFLKRINPSHAPRAEELSQEVFLALVYAAREQIPLSTLNMYAWGVARNKLKMLYRSKDWKTRKTLSLGYLVFTTSTQSVFLFPVSPSRTAFPLTPLFAT